MIIQRYISLFFLFFLLFLSLDLGAEELFQFDTFTDYYGGIEPDEGYETLRNRVFVRPRYRFSDPDSASELVVSANVWVDTVGEGECVDSSDILYETYFLKQFNTFDLVAGQKLVSYGFADVYGPFNVVNSANRDLLSLDDGFDSAKPNPLLQCRFFPSDEDIVEFTYVPITRADQEREDDVFLDQSNDTVIFSDEAWLVDKPNSFFFNYSHYGERIDYQLFYGWYTDHTPDFKVTTIDSAAATDIETVYNRKQTMGGAYATRIGSTTFSQDIALNITKDFTGTDIGVKDSDITVNTQLLLYLPGDVLSQFSFVYSYFFNHEEYDTGDDAEAAEYLAEEIHDFHNQPYQHIAFAVGHFEKSFLREKLKSSMNVGFFFSPNIYFAPRLAYSVTDHVSFETGMDYTLGGPKDIALRRNPNNDNFYTRMLMRY